MDVPVGPWGPALLRQEAAHGQRRQAQVVLLAQHRHDHREAAEVAPEGVAVDGEGAEALDELDDVGLARDLELLWLLVQEDSNLGGQEGVKQIVTSGKNRPCS